MKFGNTPPNPVAICGRYIALTQGKVYHSDAEWLEMTKPTNITFFRPLQKKKGGGK